MDGRQAVDRFQVTACAAAGRPWALDSQQQSHPQQQQQPELLTGSRGAVEEIIAIFPSRHLPSSSSDAGPTTNQRDFLGFLSLREIEVGTAHALPGIRLMTCPLACGERICSRKPKEDGGESQTWIPRFQFTGKKTFLLFNQCRHLKFTK